MQTAESVSTLSSCSSLEAKLAQIWAKVLEVKYVGTNDDFFDLGGDSLMAVSLLAEIEEQLGQKLPLSSLFHHSTLIQQAALIHQQSQSSATAKWPTLVPIQEGGSHPPLFYVHPLGGNVLCYRDLALSLGSDYTLYGLQAFGLDGVHNPHSQVDQIAAHYIQEIMAVQPRGPYFLGGFSFGGLVVFEMAQQLRQRGEEIALLALFDTNVPGSMVPISEMSEEQKVLLYWKEKLVNHMDNLHHLEPHRRLAYLQNRLRLLPNLTSHFQNSIKHILSKPQPRRDKAQIPVAIELIKSANRVATDSYLLKPYSGKIILFQALKEPVGFSRAVANGWTDYAEEITVHPIPSDHNTIMSEPWVSIVAEQLKIELGHSQKSLVDSVRRPRKDK